MRGDRAWMDELERKALERAKKKAKVKEEEETDFLSERYKNVRKQGASQDQNSYVAPEFD